MTAKHLFAFAALTASTLGFAQHPSQYAWKQSLPVRWGDPAITAIGGTEIRALVPFDGKLFAANGYWMDTKLNDPNLPGPQVLRLDRPGGEWKVDLELKDRMPSGPHLYLAISVIEPLRFTKDRYGKKLVRPADLLLASVWKRGVGLDLFSRVAGSNEWTKSTIPGEGSASRGTQIRAFATHTDSVTGEELAFAGATRRIFAGEYGPVVKKIVWKTDAEWKAPNSSDNLNEAGAAKGRVTSFTNCNGKLYATAFDTLLERVDGQNATWRSVFTTEVRAAVGEAAKHVSGMRGATCINGGRSLLIAVEDRPTRVLRVDLTRKDSGGTYPGTVDMDVSALLSEKLHTNATYGITAYNNMATLPGPNGCTRYAMGVEANTPRDPKAYLGHLAGAYMLIRECDASYTLHEVVDTSLSPKPSIESLRAVIPSPFADDPAGTLYAGGYDCNAKPAHNTAWLYRGVPEATTKR